MVLTGFHAVLARIKRHASSITQLYVTAERRDARMKDLLAAAKAAGLQVHTVDSFRLDALAKGQRHQGVVALAEQEIAGGSLADILDAQAHPFLLVLDGVTDPRNLGACLRVADGAGVHAVIAPKDHSCLLTDIAIQTASGAAESVPYILVTNLSRAMDEMQERNVWVVGTSDAATQSVFDVQYPSSIAWVLGAEGKGMRRLTQERCDELVSIPMAGSVSSLNVSVATGVVLYETLRQRRSLR